MRIVGVLLMWIALCSAAPAAFAAPWLMIFQVADPPRRVVFSDWTENQELMLAISAAPTCFGCDTQIEAGDADANATR